MSNWVPLFVVLGFSGLGLRVCDLQRHQRLDKAQGREPVRYGKPKYVIRMDIINAEPKGDLWIKGPRRIRQWPHWSETVMGADGKEKEIITLN